MKKAILITGVAGFIGSRLADWVFENKPEYDVIGIDNLFGGFIENVDKRVKFYKLDLSFDNIEDIFNENDIEYVFHFAAYAAEGLSPFIRKFNDMNNIVSTDNIINSCVSHNVKRLVYTSSMSVYGYGSGKAFTEEDTPNPIDPYGVSKYACELNIKSAGEQFGLDWCIVRPHNVYGVKQNIWDKYRNVLGIWMYQALNNKPMLIYGDGEQTRAFSYIDDCVWCFWNAATEEIASKEIINLGGIHKCTINFANDVFKDISGYDKVEHKEERYEVKHAVPTFLKSTQILGYEHKTSLRDGISAMWEWAKNQPMRDQYKWENYEIIKGIYSYWK